MNCARTCEICHSEPFLYVLYSRQHVLDSTAALYTKGGYGDVTEQGPGFRSGTTFNNPQTLGAGGRRMQFVTIPFDYDELPESTRAAVIPICIARDDEEGRPIAWGWFEAIGRIPDRMLALARRYLRDP